jgi:hypothetical protein
MCLVHKFRAAYDPKVFCFTDPSSVFIKNFNWQNIAAVIMQLVRKQRNTELISVFLSCCQGSEKFIASIYFAVAIITLLGRTLTLVSSAYITVAMLLSF